MANGNFVVQNGLTIGPLTIFAGNGDIVTQGNVSSTSQTSTEQVNQLTANVLVGGLNGNLSLTGSIIPSANISYDLGDATHQFRHVFVGPGSLYVNGKQVLTDNSGTITISTSSAQNLQMATSGGGTIQLTTNAGGGVIAVQGPLQIAAGNNITSSDGNAIQFSNQIATDNITSHTTNNNLTLSANGTGQVVIQGPLVVNNGETDNGGFIASSVQAATLGNVGATIIGSNISIPTQLTSTAVTSNYGQFNVGGAISYGPDYGLIGSYVANIPGYAYVAVQNLSTNGNASASFTAYNNTGASYLELGINSSNFNATASGFVNNSVNLPNASYAYAQQGDMIVGTWNNNGLHFITNASTNANDSMFISGNGNVYISGNLTVSGQQTQIQTVVNFLTESANVVQTAYLQGNVSTNNGSVTLQSNLVPSGTVYLGTSGSPYTNAYATNLYGTLQTAVQNNITSASTLATVGTITSGIWNASVVGATYGGTGVNNGSNTLTLGASVTINQNLRTTDTPTFGGITTPSITKSGTNGTGDIGSSSNYFGTVYGKATTAQYADLAENYQADKFYNPGTVLMFGGAQEVTTADADTTAVAGVVSTNPAHLMNGALSGANVVAVAFTGRVPCSVIGPVKKGDLMVSAGFGFAKASIDPKVGQVIGKALQDFPITGKGVIEVVVGRF